MSLKGLVHFDAFSAFCPDALMHFGSGIQVQPRVGVGVGNCVSKENPKSDLDLDLGFVNILEFELTYISFLYFHLDCQAQHSPNSSFS